MTTKSGKNKFNQLKDVNVSGIKVILSNIALFITGLLFIVVAAGLASYGNKSAEPNEDQFFVTMHNEWDQLSTVTVTIPSSLQNITIAAMESWVNIRLTVGDLIKATGITKDSVSLDLSFKVVDVSPLDIYFTSQGVVTNESWIPFPDFKFILYKDNPTTPIQNEPVTSIYSRNLNDVAYPLIDQLDRVSYTDLDYPDRIIVDWAGWSNLLLSTYKTSANSLTITGSAATSYQNNEENNAWSICCNMEPCSSFLIQNEDPLLNPIPPTCIPI